MSIPSAIKYYLPSFHQHSHFHLVTDSTSPSSPLAPSLSLSHPFALPSPPPTFSPSNSLSSIVYMLDLNLHLSAVSRTLLSSSTISPRLPSSLLTLRSRPGRPRILSRTVRTSRAVGRSMGCPFHIWATG
eukprot:764171-Hanusia_phi.AAC.13